MIKRLAVLLLPVLAVLLSAGFFPAAGIRSDSGGTDTLSCADSVVLYTEATTVTLPDADTNPCVVGRQVQVCAQGTFALTVNRAGSDTVGGTTSVTLTGSSATVDTCWSLMPTSNSAWRALQLGGSSALVASAAETRLVTGVPTIYEQTWSGSAWADVGAGEALTVESASTITFSGETATLPALLDGTTVDQPHESNYKAYYALSGLSFWSGTEGATYRVCMTQTSMEQTSDNARWGWALVTPSAAYDASSETLIAARSGWSTVPATDEWIARVASGTGTYGAFYVGAGDIATTSCVTIALGIDRAFAYIDGASTTADAAYTPPVALPTHIYLEFMAGGGILSADVDVVDPRFRITRVGGTP